MKFATALACIQLIAPGVLADPASIPLPGLETKPHLRHLKREHLALDKLMSYDVSGPVVHDGKESVHFYGNDAPLTQE
jgi:hypothetical protein